MKHGIYNPQAGNILLGGKEAGRGVLWWVLAHHSFAPKTKPPGTSLCHLCHLPGSWPAVPTPELPLSLCSAVLTLNCHKPALPCWETHPAEICREILVSLNITEPGPLNSVPKMLLSSTNKFLM